MFSRRFSCVGMLYYTRSKLFRQSLILLMDARLFSAGPADGTSIVPNSMEEVSDPLNGLYSSRRPSSDFSNVTSSAYSRALPMGKPMRQACHLHRQGFEHL